MPANKKSMYEIVGGRFDDPVSLIRYFTASYASLHDGLDLSIAHFYEHKDHTHGIHMRQEGVLQGMLTHRLESDIMLIQEYAITNDMSLDGVLSSPSQSNGSLPPIVVMTNHGHIQKETTLLIDSVIPFLSSIKTNDILFNTRQMPKLMAYKDLLLQSGLFYSLSTPAAKEKTIKLIDRHFNPKNRGR